MKGGAMDGMDALLATVQMPSGIPVATVALNGAKNAAWLAAEILALSDDELAAKLTDERAAMAWQIAAKARSEAQTHFLDQDDKELDALIYFSCVPWLDLTALTNERDFDRDDNIPRIAWGKYVPDGTGRETLGMSVEVNHRFLDGVHLGKFYQALQASIDALEP